MRLTIAIAALVAGCSSSQQTETTSSASTTVGSVTTAPVATTSGPATTMSGGGFVTVDDLPDWPASYTGPREGPFFYGSLEHLEYIVACMTDLGYPWSLNPETGMISVAGTDASTAAGYEAQKACGQKAIDVG